MVSDARRIVDIDELDVSDDGHGDLLLQSEHYYHAGGNNGPWREWSPSGALLVDDYWQCGVLVRRRRYDEHGTLTCNVVDIDLDNWAFVERPMGWGRDLGGAPSR